MPPTLRHIWESTNLYWLPGHVDSNGGKSYQEAWRSVYLPPEKDVKLFFEQQSIHPFLAEYNYRLRFISNGQTSYQQLFVNYGGRTHFNLYRLQDGRLLFRDKDWDYVVEAAGRRTFLPTCRGGKTYLAAIPNENISSWSSSESADGKIIINMNRHKIPAQEAVDILDGMTYYGCITNKFYPASEKPESKIKRGDFPKMQ